MSSLDEYLATLLGAEPRATASTAELDDFVRQVEQMPKPPSAPPAPPPPPQLDPDPSSSTLAAYRTRSQTRRARPPPAAERAPEPPVVAGTSSSISFVPSKLSEHLSTAYPDAPLRTQMKAELTALLRSARSSDDISAQLVEILGFEALDLVTDVLGAREEVGKALEVEITALSRASSAPTSHRATPPPPMHEDGHAAQGPRTHVPSAQVRVQTTQEIKAAKAARAEARRAAKAREHGYEDGSIALTAEEAERHIQEQLEANANRPLFSGNGAAIQAVPVYPHVYSSSNASGNVLSAMGSKFMLPIGTTREEHEVYEEVIIPPARTVPPRETERLVPIVELDALCKGSFPGYKSLNRIQSIVFPTAYKTNENMLICAPTGAGKTDVAMLAVLRVISQYANAAALAGQPTQANGKAPAGPASFGIAKDDFKIIYVAPMKALAAEITRKLGKRLAWLNMKVRELTGDMQMTKAEINETQIIVTTPEKWDVVTRKPTGEGELASKVRLLIIDEVHLLNEERGAVIETIVARTLRQVESSQSLIRIVGLSATLPNYIDVADFLRVNRYTGLFYFDSSFRPVPLEQHFIGVKGKPNSPMSKRNLDQATFEKVSELVEQGHSVMVFVHARKETVKTAETLKDMAMKEGLSDAFDTRDHPKFEWYRREIGTSRNKEMKQLFDSGFGIHHAGMLRSDRNMMEKMFEDGAIKVLCCTATLAWGVNLPAHAVVIKGTQVYDSSKGSFTDLSILDVLQIFGRSGRPGYSTSGVAWLCTTQDKLDHYINLIASQHPIESKFHTGIVDSLNAEIALGTVANVAEAVQWLSFTYLFVRMRRNPMAYGMTHDEPVDDPQLGGKRVQLITSAARQLAAARMIQFDEVIGSLTAEDLGKIASRYYIRHESISIFNKELRPFMSEADVLAVVCQSVEFDQVQVRESEVPELKKLMEEVIPCQVKGGTDTSQGKVNILLQAHISRAFIEDFALVSDSAYAAQNGGRIIRALFEIGLSRRWATTTLVLMSMSKAIEKRLWPFDHPLKQQFGLSEDVLYNLTRWADELAVSEIAEYNAADLGQLIHLNERHGSALLRAARGFPTLGIRTALRPLSHDVLQVTVLARRAFDWNDKASGGSEPFWLWAEGEDAIEILQWSHVFVRPTSDVLKIDFVVPIDAAKRPTSLGIRAASDRWLGAEELVTVSLEDLILPPPPSPPAPLLQLPFVPVSALSDPALEAVYGQRIRSFNAIQSQCFWSFYHSSASTVVCAPAAAGKSTLTQLAIWQAFRKDRNAKVLIVVPRRSLARDIAYEMRRDFAQPMGIKVSVLASGDDLDRQLRLSRSVLVATPVTLIRLLRSSSSASYLQKLALVVAEDLHLLDAQHELALAALRAGTQPIGVRFVCASASLDDPSDLARWFGVQPEMLHGFHPKDRGVPLVTNVQTFSVVHSAALMKSMIKPTYNLVKSAAGPAILFVPSRTQCRTVSNDLVTTSATDADLAGLAGAPAHELEPYLEQLRDKSLASSLLHGIGIYHDGVAAEDLALTLELFVSGVLRVLIAPREACWTLPVRASLVVVMGTQYVEILGERGEAYDRRDRQVRDYPLVEVARMQGFATGAPATGAATGAAGQLVLMVQDGGNRDLYTRFLHSGLPLESSLEGSDALREFVRFERRADRIRSPQDVVDLLSHTFLFRRLSSNPSFYDANSAEERDARLSRIVDAVWEETNPPPPPPPKAPKAMVGPPPAQADAKPVDVAPAGGSSAVVTD